MTVGDVIPMQGAAPGDFTFVQCPCVPGEPPLVTPVVCHDAKGSFIAALMCPECETTYPVEFGRLRTHDSEGK